MLNQNCFSINTYLQLEKIIQLRKNKRRKLVVFIKNYLVKGFGINWLSAFINLVKEKFPEQNIKFFVDAGNDYGLSILILREKIDYLRLKSNLQILKKINQIAKKNKVVLNPTFNVVDLSKIKNYKKLKI